MEALGPTRPGVLNCPWHCCRYEKNAVHPIAKAIVNYSEQKNIPITPIDDFKSVPGYGLEAKVGSKMAYIGRFEFIRDRIELQTAEALSKKIETLKETGELLTIMLVDHTIFLFRFSDAIRPKMKETIQQLRQTGRWRLLMLTGDHVTSARKIAKEVGIDEYYADLLPEHKLQYALRWPVPVAWPWSVTESMMHRP